MGPRGVRGGGEGEDATKAYLIPGLCPSKAAGRGWKRLGEATQGSTHTLLLVTRAPNQPFQ